MRCDNDPFFLVVAMLILAIPARAENAELGGIKFGLDRYDGPATLSGSMEASLRLRIGVERNGETGMLRLKVNLPVTGPKAWPAADVVVRNLAGEPLNVQRSGIEWEKLLITLVPEAAGCVIEAVEPANGWPVTTSEKDRRIEETSAGIRVRIAPWPEGRLAALSIRFDDSHPSHLSKAIPILRKYGLRGTFMVNPGPREPGNRRNYTFETQYEDWSAIMRQGDQELANHSAHHRGATSDSDMESEIGSAARAIWKLMPPGQSRLTALNLGGGTRWETSRPLRYYLDKYHHFDASSGSLGMDDVYGGRVEAFRKMLKQHLERGLWCRIHFHSIGEGLSSTEANFRAALDLARENRKTLWIAGMADIHKYQTARDTASLHLGKSKKQGLSFRLECKTNPELYDEALAVEIELPPTWDPEKVRITSKSGSPLESVVADDKSLDRPVLRIRVPAENGEYFIAKIP